MDADAPATILHEVNVLWADLEATLTARDEDDLRRPGAAGDWSGTEVVAHLGRWLAAAHDVVSDHLAGRVPTEAYDDYDAWNAHWHAEDATLSLAEARDRCTRAYQALRRLVDELPPQRWDATVREWVSGSSIHHVRAHLPLPRA